MDKNEYILSFAISQDEKYMVIFHNHEKYTLIRQYVRLKFEPIRVSGGLAKARLTNELARLDSSLTNEFRNKT
jgi:hypothetical protein